MKLEPGDLVLVPFPFTDLTAKKTRPALVLSTAGYNAGPDVICCAVTSNLSNAANSVLIESDDLASGRLAATSRVKVDKVATLQRSIIRRKVASVKAKSLAQVMKEFRTLFPPA